MKVLKFRLSGEGAMFTNPSVNSIITSYPHIHKVALLGILGAVIGIEKETVNPTAFYGMLNNLKISIVPSKYSFDREVVTKTDTSGLSNYASQKGMGKYGVTYVSHYNELVSPSWDIYIQERNDNLYKKLKDYLLNRISVYIPYLGKNWLMASIDDIEVVDCKEIYLADKVSHIDSLFLKKEAYFDDEDDFDDFNEDNIDKKYVEFFAPIGLDFNFGVYEEEEIAFTNKKLDYVGHKSRLLSFGDKILYFM